MRGRVGQAVVILWTVLFFHFCEAVPVLPVGLVATYETVKPGEPCRDNTGAEVDNGDSWIADCSERRCLHEIFQHFILITKCTPILEKNIFDKAHCRPVGNPSKDFPECCPQLTCDERQDPSVPPVTCVDKHKSPTACAIWRDKLNGCNAGSIVYRITQENCRKTCGFCS